MLLDKIKFAKSRISEKENRLKLMQNKLTDNME